MCTIISKNVLTKIVQLSKYLSEAQCRLYSSEANRSLIISCHKKKLNYYSNTCYGKLEEIVLASKGWTHNKSHGDHFTIHSQPNTSDAPSVNFEEVKIAPPLIEVLHRSDILKATNFQAEVIPIIRSGQHTMLAAETGCGKTLAYLLPIIENVMKRKTNELNMPTALIIVPNRELAIQIGEVASVLASSFNLKVNVIVGGSTKKFMMNPTFDDIDILVGTPGVIGKLSTIGIYKLNEVEYAVFDEADTLFDDSFADRIPTIAKRVSKAQFIFVSATLPKKIPDVFEPVMENLVTIKSPRLHKPLLNVTQQFLRLTKSGRVGHLLEIAKMSKGSMVVFSNRNETCNWLAMFLRENGLKCANINGDMNYHIRVNQWNQFCKGDVNILSATDVGSRGLDTTQVRHVVNFDFPLYASDYIHRVGRTGRLGSSNNSKITNFVCSPREIQLVQQIEMAVRTGNEIPNVDGNIKALVEKHILKKMREIG